MNATAIKQLDDVLNFVYTENRQIDVNSEHQKFPNNLTRDELVGILEQFFIDGFLIDRGNNRSIFSMNYKGRIFKEEGGYDGDFKRRESQIAMAESAKVFQHEQMIYQGQQAARLNRLTTWIVRGTIAAGIYYLLEIFRIWILPHLICK